MTTVEGRGGVQFQILTPGGIVQVASAGGAKKTGGVKASNPAAKKVGASSNQPSLASSTAKTGTNVAAEGFAASW